MWLYHLGAFLKIAVGLIVLVSIYMTIYPQEDPAIAMGFGFLGLFSVAWWLSFYIFYAVQYISTHKPPLQCAKESYHLSLLFGMFVLANAWLILLERRTKAAGVTLLVVFVALQVILSLTPDDDGTTDTDDF